MEKMATQAQINTLWWLGLRHAALRGDLSTAVWQDPAGRWYSGEEIRAFLPGWIIKNEMPRDLSSILVYNCAVPYFVELLNSIGIEIVADCFFQNLRLQWASWLLDEMRPESSAAEFAAFYEKMEKKKRILLKKETGK